MVTDFYLKLITIAFYNIKICIVYSLYCLSKFEFRMYLEIKNEAGLIFLWIEVVKKNT